MEENGYDSVDDEVDNQPPRNDKPTRRTPDNISINSANSDMVLLPNPNKNHKLRRPASQEIPFDHHKNSPFINPRGYVSRNNRSRSPSPNRRELTTETLGDFISAQENPRLAEQRGRARSLMDLRVAALTGEAQRQDDLSPNLYKSKSIENILTGQVHRLAPKPNVNGSVTSETKPQGRGIHAMQKRRAMEDSAF